MKDVNHNFWQGAVCGLQSQIRAKNLVVKCLEPRRDKKARTLPASTISVRGTPKIMGPHQPEIFVALDFTISPYFQYVIILFLYL